MHKILFIILLLLFITYLNTLAKMSVRVRFEFGSYKVQESCTMLPGKLIVIGEVTKSFTVGIVPMGYYNPSAKGIGFNIICVNNVHICKYM